VAFVVLIAGEIQQRH